jgi:hypothetical protein
LGSTGKPFALPVQDCKAAVQVGGANSAVQLHADSSAAAPPLNACTSCMLPFVCC